MLCTEEGLSGVLTQNPLLYLYQVTLIGKQTWYFDMLDVSVFMKPTQTYMAKDKLFFPTFCQVSKTLLFLSKQVV